MKKILFLFQSLILTLLLNYTLSYARTEHSNGPCPMGSANGEWTATIVYATGVDSEGKTVEYIVCTMGVGCNGKSWNSCGAMEAPSETNSNKTDKLKDAPNSLKQFYHDIRKGLLIYGDKFNTNFNKFEDHTNTVLVSPKVNSILEVIDMNTGEVVTRTSIVKGNDIIEIDKRNLKNGVYSIVIRDKDDNIVGSDTIFK